MKESFNGREGDRRDPNIRTQQLRGFPVIARNDELEDLDPSWNPNAAVESAATDQLLKDPHYVHSHRRMMENNLGVPVQRFAEFLDQLIVEGEEINRRKGRELDAGGVQEIRAIREDVRMHPNAVSSERN